MPNRLTTLLLVWTTCLGLWADDRDWPQWRGSNRDGHAAEQSLLKSWPENGPTKVWEFSETGMGYSSCSIVGDRLYTLGEIDDRVFAICLNFETGVAEWRTDFSRAGIGEDYNHGWGGGPRSTPTVDGDQVFVLSDVGVLAALDRESGKLQWSVDYVEDFGGKIPVWGYSESPLVDGDRVMGTPGNSNFMMGFDRKTGDKVWTSQDTDQPAQYGSIMKGRAGETDYYITASKPGLFAFNAENGKPLFSDTATGNNVAVIPTPIILPEQIYHTSDYGAGNTFLQLSEEEPGKVTSKTIYHMSDKTMRNHHGGVVLVDGVVYGFAKVNGNVWMAQDLESGEVLWEHRIRPNKSGSIAYADGRLYCYNDKDGTIYLVEPNRQEWIEHGKLKLPRETEIPRDRGAIWAHPVIAGGKLVIRDQDLIFCFDIEGE